MKILHFMLLLLLLLSSSQPNAATETTINAECKTSLLNSTEEPGAIGPHCPADTPHCTLDITGLDDTRYEHPEPHRCPTQIPTTALNKIPVHFPPVTHPTHNSSVPRISENISVSQVRVRADSEYTTVAVEGLDAPVTGDIGGDGAESVSSFRSISLNPDVTLSEQCESLTKKGLRETKHTGFISAQSGQEVDLANNHSTSYDHQNIVVLEDNPVVMEAASFLYEKHPSVSTLLSYQKGALHVIKGSRTRLTRESRLVLVGHGSRGGDGAAILGGYRAEEVARVVGAMETEDGRVRTVSVVGCELGKDLSFAAQLLRALRSLCVETKLHLRRSALSVTRNGEKVTREGVDGPPVWRHKDARNKVIAWLDGVGNLMTKLEGNQRGQVVPQYQGQALSDWPNGPMRFLPQDESDCIKFLEALTWGIFFQERPRANGEMSRYFALDGNEKNVEVIHIRTIADLVGEIRYHARLDNPTGVTLYNLNNYIYRVVNSNMYTYLEGRLAPRDNNFLDNFRQYRRETYPEIRNAPIRPFPFHQFCAETFSNVECRTDCARNGHYFMAAVFAESVRNFRNFPLFLMSIAGCQQDQNRCKDFVTENTHPMARGGSWIFTPRRGFYGSSSIGVTTVSESETTQLTESIRIEREMFTDNLKLLPRQTRGMTALVAHLNQLDIVTYGGLNNPIIVQGPLQAYIEMLRPNTQGSSSTAQCA